MLPHNFHFTPFTFTMAGHSIGSTSFGLSLLMLFMGLMLFAAVHAAHEDAAVEAKDGTGRDGVTRGSELGKYFKYGKMSFSEDHEGSNSDHPTTCTCTCYPGAAPKAPKAPSQNSPTGRKRSPPPAPYYSPSPVYNSPPPPAGSTQSPITFDSPPPPAPYYDVPTYGEPSPVVAAPETFQPPPPIY